MTDIKKIQNTPGPDKPEVGHIQGIYRGQPVVLVQDTEPSAIQLASHVAGFEIVKGKIQESILNRQIVSKSVFREKEKTLSFYTERLGQTSQARQYKEVYADLSRQQYKQGYHEEENQDAFRDALLYKVAENFGEVTEQDNVLEYGITINKIERGTMEIEVAQVRKMIEFFSEPQKHFINIGFANTERMKWTEKLMTLEAHLQTNARLGEQLIRARELLQKTHKQEIRDGYNLIPKAAAVLNQRYGGGETSSSAISLAITYRDEILGMTSPLDVFETFIRRQEKKRESFRPYIDDMIALFGIDMSSSNPSRSKEELFGVRNGLFRLEICGQIYDNVGELGREVRRMFPATSTGQIIG